MNATCLLILDPEFELLGEAVVEHGICRQVRLNRGGDALLGDFLDRWQTQGLSALDIQHIRTQEGSGEAWVHEPTGMQSADFPEALGLWLEDHGFHQLRLPLGAMQAWGGIQRMDIEPQKKFELALMLRDLSIHRLVSA